MLQALLSILRLERTRRCELHGSYQLLKQQFFWNPNHSHKTPPPHPGYHSLIFLHQLAHCRISGTGPSTAATFGRNATGAPPKPDSASCTLPTTPSLPPSAATPASNSPCSVYLQQATDRSHFVSQSVEPLARLATLATCPPLVCTNLRLPPPLPAATPRVSASSRSSRLAPSSSTSFPHSPQA